VVINTAEIFPSNSLEKKKKENFGNSKKKKNMKIKMRPTNSQAIHDRVMITPASIANMEHCLRHLTTTTNRVNYVHDLIKDNHSKQQSIQSRYHAISNSPTSGLGKTIKPLMEEQGRVCDENELLMSLVNDMGFRLQTCENIITRIGHHFTTHLKEKPTMNTFKSSINKKSITKARNIKACYFCAKPGHIYAQCRNANQAQKNFISNLLHSGGFDFERFKKCVATEESKQAKNQGKSADEE
jgi:hypothetical protein